MSNEQEPKDLNKFDNLDPNGIFRLLETGLKNVFYKGASDENILALEKYFGVQLPSTFKEFLKLTDGAVIEENDELFRISDNNQVEDEEEKTPRPSVKTAYRALVDEGMDHNLIPFLRSGYTYCFDTSRPLPNGEYKIVAWNEVKSRSVDLLDNSFAEFMKRNLVTVYHRLDQTDNSDGA